MKKETKAKAKWKQHLIDASLEIILEIVFGLICLAIGVGVFVLFGKGIDDIDFELAILMGVGVILALVIVICFGIHLIKKKKQPDNNDGISPLNRDNE